MKAERKLLLKVSLGLTAGLLSVAIIQVLNRSGIYIAWAQIVAAALIGVVAGAAEKSKNKMILGMALGCVGWISGELFSRLLFHSIATWIFVGGFVGLTAGILEKSPVSVIGGMLLGAIGGLAGVGAGLSTIIIDPLRNADMQAMSILGAALFISLVLGLKRPKSAAGAVVSGSQAGTQEPHGET